MQTKILDVIACPKCHQSLHFDEQKTQLVCDEDKLIFNIVDRIPVLIEREAINQEQTS